MIDRLIVNFLPKDDGIAAVPSHSVAVPTAPNIVSMLFALRAPNKTPGSLVPLLYRRILRLGLLEDGNIGISIFPKRKKIFISRQRPHSRSIGVRALRSPRLQSGSPSHDQMRQRPRPATPYDADVIQMLGALLPFCAHARGFPEISRHSRSRRPPPTLTS